MYLYTFVIYLYHNLQNSQTGGWGREGSAGRASPEESENTSQRSEKYAFWFFFCFSIFVEHSFDQRNGSIVLSTVETKRQLGEESGRKTM